MSTALSSKNFIDHAAEYTSTTEGAWDLFRFAEQACTNLRRLPSLTEHHSALLEKVSHVMNRAGIALSIPKAISHANAFVKSFASAYFSTDLPYSDPERSAKIQKAYKNALVNGVNLSNTVSQAALFLHHAKLNVVNPLQYRLLDGFFNVTSLLSDGADLVSQCFKLKKYHSAELQLTQENADSTKISEKKRLAWLTIAQDTSAVALSLIALAGLSFGAVVESLPLFSIAGLFLGTTWIGFKISAYFYKEIVVKQPLPT